MNRLLARAAATATLLVPLVLTSAAPALASCVMPGPIEDAIKSADSVFVGTITSVANSSRWATVAVDEVWSGPDLAPVVEVRGGSGPGTGSSVDRQFAAGTRYLFVLSIFEGALSDNACSSTTEWDPGLAKLRPASAHPPIAPAPEPADAAFDLQSLLLPGVLVLAAGVVVFGAALAVRRSR